MTVDDEAGSKSMTCRPVRVRSRPISRFPEGEGRCCAAVDRQTGHSNRPGGTAETNPALGSEPAYVPFDSK